MIQRAISTAAVIAAAFLAMVFATDGAWAGKRVALVVGNSAYQTVPQLPNPSRDANSIAKMFRDAGFDTVDIALNVGNLEFKRAIRKFEATADQAEMAVVYYAGHGLEIGATNYLIPIDARLASDRDADDEAISLERLVSSADGASRLRLIILDACRDNPFVGMMRRERKVANRAVTAGLGKVEPTSSDTLIAYAAKAGSTANDGDGDHSPFTAAILKDLTVPGLDVRLAFGRVRDDVLKSTGNQQEPFVYGSLGGGNVSLVPAPEKPQEVPVGEVKADYELVQKIGTKRAWEVFLGTHPTGFYAELAKAQIERIATNQPVLTSAAPGPTAPTAPPAPNITLAALPPESKPPNREASTKEAVEWDKIKDATDPATLQKFISRFPDSPLALNAQQRIDILKKAQAEREEQARQAAEQARQAVADAKRRAAEAAAQKKREDDARRAAEAETAEKAKAAAAELAAQKKREADERRAAAAEAERQAKAAEAANKAKEAQQKAEQTEREKAVGAAAAAAAAAEKQAREAEAARKKAELAAQKEAACKDEQGMLDAILSKGSDGTGVDDLKTFSKTVTCDRLGPVVVAAIDRFRADAAKRAATAPNSPALVTSAQNELIRLGCLTGKIDGTLNPATTAALTRYLGIEGQPTDKPTVTRDLVTELSKHTTRVCPIECKTGETLKDATCVADKPAEMGPASVSRKHDDNDDTPRRKQAKKEPEREREQPHRQKPAVATAPEAPRARQQALARPSIVSGGGGSGGGHSTMIGVGF